jgi:hypothetical protein
MKRQPSLKRPTKLSDSADAVDQYRSAALEPPRAARRKQIEKLDPAADLQRSEEWDATALDLEGPQPRR